MTGLNHTATDAAAIIARNPTAEEMAETNVSSVVADKTLEHVDSIEEAAQKAFNKASDNAESELLAAASMLALRLCGQQIKATLTDGVYEPATDQFVWNNLIHGRATMGKMVWRKTQKQVEEIRAAKGDEKKKLVKAYVTLKHVPDLKTPDGKPVNVKLVSGLEQIKTYGFRLAGWIRANRAAGMVEAARAATAKDAIERWNGLLVAEGFGDTWSQFTETMDEKLAPEKEAAKAKRKADKAAKEAEEAAKKAAKEAEEQKGRNEAFDRMDPIVSVMSIVEGMSNDMFRNLMERLANEARTRGLWTPKAEETATDETKPEEHNGPTLELTAVKAEEAKPQGRKRNGGNRKAA